MKASDLSDNDVVRAVHELSHAERPRMSDEERARWPGLAALADMTDRIHSNTPPELLDEAHWVTRWDLGERFPGFPSKVMLAKIRKLIRRGLLDGCTCGCRGDLEVTAAGADLIGVPYSSLRYPHSAPPLPPLSPQQENPKP